MTAVMSVGSPRTLVIPQGRQFSVVFVATDWDEVPIDLSGYSAEGELRIYPRGLRTATFDISMPDPTNGEVWCTLSESDTNVMERSGVWDVKLIEAGGIPVDFIGGRYVIKPEVTE